jgi:hypothetical protein
VRYTALLSLCIEVTHRNFDAAALQPGFPILVVSHFGFCAFAQDFANDFAGLESERYVSQSVSHVRPARGYRRKA